MEERKRKRYSKEVYERAWKFVQEQDAFVERSIKQEGDNGVIGGYEISSSGPQNYPPTIPCAARRVSLQESCDPDAVGDAIVRVAQKSGLVAHPGIRGRSDNTNDPSPPWIHYKLQPDYEQFVK